MSFPLPRLTVVVLLISLMPLGQGVADEGLVAHWKFKTDVRDSSGHGLDAVNHGATLGAEGPDGSPQGAISFDGRDDVLNVASQAPLDFGTDNFSIAVWVHLNDAGDDIPGDIVSKYDSQSRTGFRLGIDSRPGVTSSQSNWRNVHFGIDAGTTPSSWTDHGQRGNAVLIYGMAVYDDQLFVGTCVAGKDQAGRVFRYDGEIWTDCGSPDRCNAVSSLAVWKGHLYVGVSKYRLGGSSLEESENLNLGGTVYRYESDGQWIPCGRLPDTQAINGMVVYRDQLYASSMYAPAGFYRYEGGTRWSSCGVPDGKRVESMAVYNGHIYATGYDEGAVYRYDGTNWEHLGVLEGATQTYGFAVHGGKLFVSEWPHARVYQYEEGQRWKLAGQLGQEKETMPLVVYNGKMYGGTLPLAEVYRYDGGEEWSQFGRLDLTPDVRYRRVWSMAVYRGRLFAGTLPAGRVHSIEVGRNVTYDRVLPSGWRHITAVKDTDRLSLYVDGQLVSKSSKFDAAAMNVTNGQPLQIGFGSTDHFNGRLSDLRLYRRALSASDVKRIHQLGTAAASIDSAR